MARSQTGGPSDGDPRRSGHSRTPRRWARCSSERWCSSRCWAALADSAFDTSPVLTLAGVATRDPRRPGRRWLQIRKYLGLNASRRHATGGASMTLALARRAAQAAQTFLVAVSADRRGPLDRHPAAGKPGRYLLRHRRLAQLRQPHDDRGLALQLARDADDEISRKQFAMGSLGRLTVITVIALAIAWILLALWGCGLHRTGADAPGYASVHRPAPPQRDA